VSLAYIGGNTPFVRSDVKNSFAGSILADVGLSRPSAQDIVKDGYQIEVSPEEIPSLDADVLFLQSVNDEKGEETWTRMKNHPLWQKLQVVQDDRVYQVDFATWRSRNILAANGILDDLFKHLINNND
jgi:iron complex transport system substrate-binding protein